MREEKTHLLSQDAFALHDEKAIADEGQIGQAGIAVVMAPLAPGLSIDRYRADPPFADGRIRCAGAEISSRLACTSSSTMRCPASLSRA